MFSPKYNYWSEYGSSIDAFHPSVSLLPAVQGLTEPFINNDNDVLEDGEVTANFTHCSPPVTFQPLAINSCFEYARDAVDEKHVAKRSFPAPNRESSYLFIQHNNEPQDNIPQDVKKCSILSKFYKADGSPIKSLWENEIALKEQRTYKYDPKPLERRKNPRSFVPDEKKTEEYWERRKKNNQAARKSREDRRRKEIEILKNVEALKSDNIKLKIFAQKIAAENQSLKYEVEMLKRL